MKIAVFLSGCGVYDGSEIHETVLTLLALDKLKISYQCFAPNINQLHVVNHLTGEVTTETRNVLVESARIARGKILALDQYNVNDYDALVLPGGFGVAKNFTDWAVNGPNCSINEELKLILEQHIAKGKPLAALCMAPTTVVKAVENKKLNLKLTLGHTEEKSE